MDCTDIRPQKVYVHKEVYVTYWTVLHVNIKKVKSILVQPWRGPEGSRRMGFRDFKATGTWR